jgi:glutamate-1-semialdehyde 2,1-aminomutase
MLKTRCLLLLSLQKNTDLHMHYAGVHFLVREIDHPTSPDQAWNSEIVDSELREKIFKLAMIQEGVHTSHGLERISAAHSKADIGASLGVIERIAKKWSN